MTVRSLFPILLTDDLPGLVAFYEAALGGEVEFRFPDEQGADAYVALRIGPASLGIGRELAASSATGERVALWFYVEDVDASFERMLAAGAMAVASPADMPWGERVAQVRDPAATLVNLGAASGR